MIGRTAKSGEPCTGTVLSTPSAASLLLRTTATGTIAHDARIRRYGRQHILLTKPIDPSRVLRRARILAPAIVRVCSDAVDCNDAEEESLVERQAAKHCGGNILDDVGRVCWCVAEHLEPDVVVCHQPDLVPRQPWRDMARV